MLPGHFPALFSGGMVLSQEASATSTAQTITAPASIVAGDILVLWDCAYSKGGTPTAVVPTGFTQIASVNSADTDERNTLSYKIADGSEAGANITGMNGSSNNDKMMYVFRGTPKITSVSVNSVASEITDGDPVAQVVTSGSGAAPLIVIGAYGSDSAIDPRSFTPAKDSEVSSNIWAFLAYKIYNSSPADVTIDMEDEGTDNSIVSCYMEAS